MLYTGTPPAGGAAHIDLFPDPAAARAAGGHPDRPLYGVAARFDARGRCLISLRSDRDEIDPSWTTSAWEHGDGVITARGPIPGPLYVRLPTSGAPLGPSGEAPGSRPYCITATRTGPRRALNWGK
jgi:hypothetical protein